MIRSLLLPLLCLCLAAQQQQSTPSLSALLEQYQAEPANSNLCQQIALAYTRLNDFTRAADFFRKALTLDPQSVPAAKNLATVLWFNGEKAASVAMFRTVAKKIPGDPVPQLYLGLSAYDGKDMESAAAHFDRAGTLASDNPEVLPVVVTSFLLSGRAQQAVNILENRIASGDSGPQIYRWLGDAYDRLNLTQKAWKAYSKAIADAPAVEDNYLALAGICIEQRNASLAREVLDRALTQLPGSAKLTLEKGLVWALQEDFDQASKAFVKASSLDSHWSLPLLALGITDLQTGDVKEATEMFRRAKQIAPDDFRCYYFHALALTRSQTSESAQLRSQAIEELHHAVALEPDRAQPRIALAQNQLSAGLLSEAEAQLHEAIRLDPSQPAAFYKLALLCRREGKKEEADRYLAAFASLKRNAEAEENDFTLLSQTVRDERSPGKN